MRKNVRILRHVRSIPMYMIDCSPKENKQRNTYEFLHSPISNVDLIKCDVIYFNYVHMHHGLIFSADFWSKYETMASTGGDKKIS